MFPSQYGIMQVTLKRYLSPLCLLVGDVLILRRKLSPDVRKVYRLKMLVLFDSDDAEHSADSLQCFGSYDDSKYQDTDLSQKWRLWLFQVCTEWGYYTVSWGPGPEVSGCLILS